MRGQSLHGSPGNTATPRLPESSSYFKPLRPELIDEKGTYGRRLPGGKVAPPLSPRHLLRANLAGDFSLFCPNT